MSDRKIISFGSHQLKTEGWARRILGRISNQQYPTIRAFLQSETSYFSSSASSFSPSSTISFGFSDRFYFNTELNSNFINETQPKLDLVFRITDNIFETDESYSYAEIGATISSGSIAYEFNHKANGSQSNMVDFRVPILHDSSVDLYYAEYSISGSLSASGHLKAMADFGSSLEFRGILFDDGTTPEFRDYQLSFASGDDSPNLISSVPEATLHEPDRYCRDPRGCRSCLAISRCMNTQASRAC